MERSGYQLARHRYGILRRVAPERARLFGDDFEYGDEEGPGTGGEWEEVACELERALAGKADNNSACACWRCAACGWEHNMPAAARCGRCDNG